MDTTKTTYSLMKIIRSRNARTHAHLLNRTVMSPYIHLQPLGHEEMSQQVKQKRELVVLITVWSSDSVCLSLLLIGFSVSL